MTRPRSVTLTPREVQVLQGLVDGYTPVQLARMWGTSQRTVDTHLKNIYRKLGARGRVQAVVMGLQAGLVQFPDREVQQP